MTIDEAIKHCLETAEQLEERANIPYKVEDSELQDNACRECAADHRQLAKWLTELKELREKIKKIEKELEVAKLINHAEFKTLCKYNHVGGSENG